MKNSLVLTLLLVTSLSPSIVLSQSLSTPLEQGLSMEEVLKRWGPPTSKDEQEVKRINIWNYSSSKVVFKEGQLVSWSSNGIEAPIAIVDETTAQGAKPVEMDDILSEIIKEVPSDDSSGSSIISPPVGSDTKPIDLN